MAERSFGIAGGDEQAEHQGAALIAHNRRGGQLTTYEYRLSIGLACTYDTVGYFVSASTTPNSCPSQTESHPIALSKDMLLYGVGYVRAASVWPNLTQI